MAENGLANSVGNNVYTELPMTRFPQALDKRGSNTTGGNENLNLHKNLEDYNMAEHVNALADAVMAIQKSLGIAPQIPTSTTETGDALINLMKTKTVKSRLDTIENKNFDTRYGGPNWVAGAGQTLEEHNHTGALGAPSKVSLTAEVQGKLPKDNVNLVYNSSTGITGANIAINSTKSDSIDKTVSDKLSQSAGGTVEKDLIVKGKSWTRWGRDYDVTDLTGDMEADSGTSGMAAFKSTTAAHTFLSEKFNDLYFGKYVLILRVKTNTLVNSNLLKVSTLGSTGSVTQSTTFKGTEFKAANTWQNLYFVFDHNTSMTNKNGSFKVEKLATTAAVKVSMEYVILTPTHPAIFDR